MSWLRQIASQRYGFMILLYLPLVGCEDGSQYRAMQGDTMGTYYRIQYAQQQSCQPSQFVVDQLLLEFNQSLSTYIPDSELSRINKATGEKALAISERLALALATANEVWRETDGAFDVTVGPLVNLWGFGAEKPAQWPPSEQQQIAASATIGMQHLKLSADGLLRKQFSQTYIDLSSIAKGQAVDEVSEALIELGCQNFLVDIGGEVRSSGVNAQGKLWRVGIEVPESGRVGSIQRVLSVSNNSVATSGDYRNFKLLDGLRVDHVIDPRSGRPADNSVVSVTVVHSSAMWADAYATALMVLGAEQGLQFAEERNLAALILTKNPTGEVVERYTSPMQAYVLTDVE
jgi:thiamine biosynthesis lipoprotein